MRIGPQPSEVSFVASAPRPTPTPPQIRFAEVLSSQAGSLVRGAEATMRGLPGAPLLALALRGPQSLSPRGLAAPSVGPASGVATNAEGPGAPTGGGGVSPGGGIEASMTESQEMNMYFLRIQEAMNAQNRTYSALSNVLKAQHDTVKNAISNIR